jgi:hypothetical protein
VKFKAGQYVYVKQASIGASGRIEDLNPRGSHAYVIPERGFWVRTDLLQLPNYDQPTSWDRGLARIRQGEESWKKSRRREGG